MTRAGERGSMTVELALVLPFIVALLGASLVALGAVGAQVRLQHAAAAAVRAHGRGDAGAADAVLQSAVPNATASVRRSGDLICLTCRRTIAAGIAVLPIETSACAIADGR